MTAPEARQLHLGMPVSIVGYTFELKKDQRHGTVVQLTDDSWTKGHVEVAVRLPNDRVEKFDSYWIHTGYTLSELLHRFHLLNILPKEFTDGRVNPLTEAEKKQVRFYYRGH
jgi:hypothetical protein